MSKQNASAATPRKSAESWLLTPQPRLGQAGLLVLLAFLSTIIPLSLDMYTPAVPHMAEHLNTDAGMVNLTLVGFYLFFAIGLLVFGPMSDRMGRKPVLIIGLTSYVAGSLACSLAPTIEFLIVARVVQALGAGAGEAMTNSIVKDAVREERRGPVLSLIQLMLILGPVIAPVVGAFVVAHFTWRTTFDILAVAGLVCLVLALLYQETLAPEHRVKKGQESLAGQLADVVKNPGFTSFMMIFCTFNLGFMAYVSVASYIYESLFGLSEMGYGLFFGATALCTAAGPFAWEGAKRFCSARTFLIALMLIGLAAGAGMLLVGHAAPLAFCVCMTFFAITEAAARPLSVNILLSQQDEGAGAASSCINFINTAAGCVGMFVVGLLPTDDLTSLAALIICCMAASLAGWWVLGRTSVTVHGITDDMELS